MSWMGDGVHLVGNAAQNGRGITGARTDLEHPFAAPLAQRLHHDGNDIRLRENTTGHAKPG
jgi:hypothetical protein